ncbi:MAG: T9SS type A sorting domain-containing protein, partial [Bacteroidota bacterium]
VELETRFLKFTFLEPLSRVREIELYGPEPNIPTCPPELIDSSKICGSPRFQMQDFIGSNTNFDIPAAKANAVGFIRNYHGVFQNAGFGDPDYASYPNNTYDWWTENESTNEVFQLDRFFQRLTDLGLEITDVIHRAHPYLVTFAYKTGDPLYNATSAYLDSTINLGEFIRLTERKPFSEELYPIGLNMTLDSAEMYLEYADFIYQFTARYGSNPDTSQLKIADDNPRVSGLGNIQYLENWNEPDKWWHLGNVQRMNFLTPEIEEQLGYFSPFEYAAMSSATFDGGGMANSIENIVATRYPNGVPAGASPVSMKSADEDMKFVMAGISELNIDYIRAVKFWFDYNRPDIDFPFDVISFHDYSNNGFGNTPLANYGLSPEEYGLRERLLPLVEYRDRYLPEVEIWLSEFGYDTAPASIQSPNCFVHCDGCESDACADKMLELQAQWITRSFLEIAAAGIDRAMVFNMRDGADPRSKGLYQTSGLTTYRLDRFQNKPSWYYVATTKHILEDTQYDPSFVWEDESVRLYRFVSDCENAQKEVYAIWSPTSERGDNSALIKNYQLPFQVDSIATLIQLEDGEVDGKRSILEPNVDGRVSVNVSERPKFIVLGELEEDMDGCDCGYIPFTVEGDGTVNHLNDEQNNIGEPYCGDGNEMETQWEQAKGDEVIIDLGGKHELNHLFFYSDTLAEGEVEIYIGEVENWQLFKTWDVENASIFRWRTFTNFDTLQTRYIRLKALTNKAFLNEVAFCGKALEPIVSNVFNPTRNNVELEITPNPFSNQIQLQVNSFELLQLTVTDVLGRIIFQKQIDGNYEIDSSNWENGIYFLNLEDLEGKVVESRKLMKVE